MNSNNYGGVIMRDIRLSKLEPEDVFNPRGEYNEEMYVKRPQYEKIFRNALKSDMCVLHGHSGTGKTWLSRRVLIEENYYFKPVNLASAANFNSIYTCFRNIMIREGWKIRTNYSETKKANVTSIVANGGLSHTSQYNTEVDYFMEFLKFMSYRARNKNRKRFIVFENFESIMKNENLIKELTNLITLIDDDEVAKYRTTFIIIGATGDIQQYFTSVTNAHTIDNRVIELPEIRTLTTMQISELFNRGFDRLDIRFYDESSRQSYIERISWITGGIPQRLHEYCLELSRICKENGWEAKKNFLDIAQKQWLSTSLNKNYACLNRIISQERFKTTRIKEILFCLGTKEKDRFTSLEICDDIKAEFLGTKEINELEVSTILDELCSINEPILYKDDVTKQYRFSDMKFLLCMRMMLYKDNDGKASLYDFSEL